MLSAHLMFQYARKTSAIIMANVSSLLVGTSNQHVNVPISTLAATVSNAQTLSFHTLIVSYLKECRVSKQLKLIKVTTR